MTRGAPAAWKRGAKAGLLVALVMLARDARADGSLAATTRALAASLGNPGHGALVVASPVTSDVAAPRGDDLAERVATLVASAVSGEAEARPLTLSAARARKQARTAAAGSLLYVEVRVASGELRLTADVYPVVKNAWDRLRAAPPPPSAHAYVHAPIGAEVRSFLAPVALERASVTRFAQDQGQVLAIACGPLEGDGADSLVVVTEGSVLSGHLHAGRFVVDRHAPAASLARRVPVPLREPLGAALVVPGDVHGSLYVGWGDRSGVATGPDLVPTAHLAGLPVRAGDDVGCAPLDAVHAGFGAGLTRCDDGRPIDAREHATEVADGLTTLDLARADGTTAHVVARHEPGGALHLARTGATELTVNDTGAAVALADLDQDGVPEVITTSAHGEDALVVSSWRAEGLVKRLAFPAPAGVDAVAVCPAETDDEPAPIVAAVGREIWLVR